MKTRRTFGFRTRIGAFFLALFVIGIVVPANHLPRARAQDGQFSQYAIKAAFLYKFIEFVEWPPRASRDSSPTITIGILGKDPFGAAIHTINGKSIRGKRLVIRYLSEAQNLENVYILFISPSEKGNLPEILQRLRNSGILTVSEMDGFPQSGGIINLTTENNRVRFEINPDAAQRARLRISSQLLRLARIVRT